MSTRQRYYVPLVIALLITAFSSGPTLAADEAILSVLGDYEQKTVSNGWHTGTISKGPKGLEWKNKEGVKWSLTLDVAAGKLRTGRDNPYDSQGIRDFTLQKRGNVVTGFTFNGELYSRKVVPEPTTQPNQTFSVRGQWIHGPNQTPNFSDASGVRHSITTTRDRVALVNSSGEIAGVYERANPRYVNKYYLRSDSGQLSEADYIEFTSVDNGRQLIGGKFYTWRRVTAATPPTVTPARNLSGMWQDSNGGRIEIAQKGNQITATGKNNAVLRWWTTATATLNGNQFTMIHRKNNTVTDTVRGTANSDSEIVWSNQSKWNRVSSTPAKDVADRTTQDTTSTPAISNSPGAEAFSMILASDSQFPWSTRDEHFKDAARTIRKSQSEIEAESRLTNVSHAASMSVLCREARHNVKGLIMNGDLTENGHFTQLDVFKEIYEKIVPVPLYPGLGNHDYANYVEPFGYNHSSALVANAGGASTVQYLMQKVDSLGIRGENFDRKGNAIHIQGSLAYSWDVGNVHFVQLNNYPLFHRSFVGIGLRYDLEICLNWLERDLSRARAANKFIILNYHDSNEHWGDFLSDDQARVLTDIFRRMITRDYPVSAVFCGHYHSSISLTTSDRDKSLRRNQDRNVTKAGWVAPQSGYLPRTGTVLDHLPFDRVDIYGNIPLFYCGSAPWSRYLLVRFNQAQKQMQVSVVNSESGQPQLSNMTSHSLRNR